MQKKLPEKLVEKIFERLHGRFGNVFFDKFRLGKVNVNNEDIGIINAKRVWAEELAHLSIERLQKGMQATYDYAPSCDDFKRACIVTSPSHSENPLLTLARPKSDIEKVKINMAKIYNILGKKND